jgi:two-component system chemotaxis response regulator CheY
MQPAEYRILTVDDHVIVHKQLGQMLRNLGYNNVEHAETAADAADKMKNGRYDVVFLDWHMPGKGGYSLLQQCREDRAFDTVAFVMVSVESDPHFTREAMKAGAVSYIIKPVTEATLGDTMRAVATWLDRRRTVPA